MACTSCKKKKSSIGSLSSADKAELEEVAWMTVGAVGSKILVNPMVKALYGSLEKKPKYGAPICKGLAAAGLWYMDTKESRAMAKGAAAAAVLEALEIGYPKLFDPTQGYKADATSDSASPPATPAATGRIHGSVMLDLDNIQGVGSHNDDRPSGRGMVLSR